MDKIKIIDFDKGCGGFSKGLEDSGFFEVVSNPLINKNNNTCYNNVHINKFSDKDIINKDADLIIYTPHSKKPNLTEISNYIAFLSINNFENVIFITKREAIPFLQVSKNVRIDANNLPTIDIISCRLIDLDYSVYQFVIDGAGFGLCQHQYYNIYWGTKNEGNIEINEGFGPFKRKYRLVKHVLRDVTDSSNLNWHNIDYSKKDLCHMVLPGENARSTLGISQNHGYIRLDCDSMAPTLYNDFYKLSGKCPSIHPYYDRPLTIREGARLFGLTDDFIWDSKLKKWDIADMIYNSFPPVISKLMANKIKRVIK